jgi:hypothetical protein
VVVAAVVEFLFERFTWSAPMYVNPVVPMQLQVSSQRSPWGLCVLGALMRRSDVSVVLMTGVGIFPYTFMSLRAIIEPSSL